MTTNLNPDSSQLNLSNLLAGTTPLQSNTTPIGGRLNLTSIPGLDRGGLRNYQGLEQSIAPGSFLHQLASGSQEPFQALTNQTADQFRDRTIPSINSFLAGRGSLSDRDTTRNDFYSSALGNAQSNLVNQRLQHSLGASDRLTNIRQLLFDHPAYQHHLRRKPTSLLKKLLIGGAGVLGSSLLGIPGGIFSILGGLFGNRSG